MSRTRKGRESARELGVGARLKKSPSPALVDSAFRSELVHAGFLYEGLSFADLAHTLMLLETGIIPPEPGRRLLDELVVLHDEGLAGLQLEAKWGDLYNNRDAELQRRLGKDSGWLHAGRARREALTIGWLLHLRSATAELLRDTLDLVRRIAEVAKSHTATLMPDFTYLQHAQPTTLGHFLLGFAYPVLRDAERLYVERGYVNRSPAGSASTNGSRLPLDRARMRELLGFDSLSVHNRDAMWQSDVAINLMSVIVSLTTTADRLAEDLQIWATGEFGFVELSDTHCRTSVIMPNKRNPYALTFIRGAARELGGNLVSVVATNQTPSGQIDNRNTSYDLIPRALATAGEIVRLLGDILSAARFDCEQLRRQAQEGFIFGTELVDLLLQREEIDARTAHDIVGTMISTQVNRGERHSGLGEALKEAFRNVTGRAPRISVGDLIPEVSAEKIVASRSGVGSCSTVSVRSMCRDLRAACEGIETELAMEEKRVPFPALLRRCVSERIGREW